MDRHRVITRVLALLFTVFCVGANNDPADHLTKLPVGLVDADKGVVVGGQQVDLGARITEAVKKATASAGKIDWKVMDESEKREALGTGKLLGALVVPADFSSAATVTGTTSAAPGPPDADRVPTADATTPIEALPAFYRFLAEFEPLRQITDGSRSILYCDAPGDAGLTRGRMMMAVAVVAAVLFGFGVLGWYDRKGLRRIPAETKPTAPVPA